MRLTSMKFKNFRQFYGESPQLVFANGERNVTVFHGCNGSGKTALLNAFTWVLYGTHTRGFQLQDQLVNKRAIREATLGESVLAYVELAFEHDQRKYIVRRQASVRKAAGDPGWEKQVVPAPTLQWCGEDGRWLKEERVEDAIGRILPVDLHSYFFFDGERIERIVQPTKAERADIANATKKFLGIEMFRAGRTPS